MNAQVTATTRFFHVPVHVLPSQTGSGYELVYDFPQVNVTWARAVILYELVEAPTGTILKTPSISTGGEFVPFVTANGLVAGFVDTDKAPGTYSVTLPYSVGTETYTSDPQVINNPIKR
jgi:hypothetical protein